jgi:dihydroxy-acid dehydratase
MRSDSVTKGAERAPMRSLFYAMGYTKEELERPLIGVVNAHSEIVPGHSHLDKITEAVKAGIRMAGGTPIEFPTTFTGNMTITAVWNVRITVKWDY